MQGPPKKNGDYLKNKQRFDSLFLTEQGAVSEVGGLGYCLVLVLEALSFRVYKFGNHPRVVFQSLELNVFCKLSSLGVIWKPRHLFTSKKRKRLWRWPLKLHSGGHRSPHPFSVEGRERGSGILEDGHQPASKFRAFSINQAAASLAVIVPSEGHEVGIKLTIPAAQKPSQEHRATCSRDSCHAATFANRSTSHHVKGPIRASYRRSYWVLMRLIGFGEAQCCGHRPASGT